MLNGLILTDTLSLYSFLSRAHTFARARATHIHAHVSFLHSLTNEAWGWRWFHQGTSPSLSPLSLSFSNTHLIDSSDLTEKREMGNWKMVGEDWKQRADYKLCEETKGFPSAFSLSSEVAGVCLTGAWLRRTKDITTANKWTYLASPDAVNILGW